MVRTWVNGIAVAALIFTAGVTHAALSYSITSGTATVNMLENDTSGPKTKYELQVTPTTSSVTISITGSATDNVDYIKIQQLGGPTSTVTLNVTGIGSIDQFTRSGSGTGKVALNLLRVNGDIGFDGIGSGRYIEATSIELIEVQGSDREGWTPIRILSDGPSAAPAERGLSAFLPGPVLRNGGLPCIRGLHRPMARDEQVQVRAPTLGTLPGLLDEGPYGRVQLRHLLQSQ